MDIVAKAKEENKRELLGKNGVWGVCIGSKVTDGVDTGEECVQVWVEEKKPLKGMNIGDFIPKTLMERNSALLIKTDVVENPMPEILTLKLERELGIKAVNRKGKHRPAMCGISISHKNVTAGTQGVVLEKNDLKHPLSNTHVIAPFYNGAQIGDGILQPGTADGGSFTDKIGELVDYDPIFFDGSLNKMDAAIYLPTKQEDIDETILDIGKVSGVKTDLKIGDLVYKSGRTSAVTSGKIIGLDGTVKVSYGRGRVAVFDRQVFSEQILDGGDSGSCIIQKENNRIYAVGLGFAGSTNMSIFTPIQPILDRFKCKVYVKEGEVEKRYSINIQMKKNQGNTKWLVDGYITEYDSGMPLKDVKITIDKKNIDPHWETNTDDTGYFAVSDVEEGEHTITAELEGYVTYTKEFKPGVDVTRIRP